MRLVDADALLKHKTDHDMINTHMIYNAPTVDAVPVIRCKDCRFLGLVGTVWKCRNIFVNMLCEPNDFCSRAERKEE